MLKPALRKLNTDHQNTVRNWRFWCWLGLGIFIALTPYLFYIYRKPPEGIQEWHVWFFTFRASGFYDVSAYLHALLTKFCLVFFSSMCFLFINRWWKWSFLIPIIVFLFQIQAVLNLNLNVFDEYSFWKSLWLTVPIVVVLVIGTLELNNKKDSINLLDLSDEIEREYFKGNSFNE